MLSHRNLDNIAKYHILNTSSNLYFNGSLPKDGQNHFKYSDFKFDKTSKLISRANYVWYVDDTKQGFITNVDNDGVISVENNRDNAILHETKEKAIDFIKNICKKHNKKKDMFYVY